MNVRCPECGTLYRVDPAKIPPGGVRARCERCPAIIELAGGESTTSVPSLGKLPARAVGAETDAAPDSQQAPEPAGDPADALLNPDPHERAKRLARALVSDIATYHGSRRDRGLRDGTLRHELRDEIRRSWDEYVGHIGNQMARETSYFRDALNEILARGQRLF